MYVYNVTPNVDVTGWFVKLSEAVAEDVYDSKDEAIEVATKLAQENSPSKVKIMDVNHYVENEMRY